MEKGDKPDLFVNDGSFFEKFKQLQQEKPAANDTKSSVPASLISPPKSSVILNKRPLDLKGSNTKNANASASGVKLAFSLKQKSKIPVAAAKFVADEEDGEQGENTAVSEPAKRQRVIQSDAKKSSVVQEDVAPSPPNDYTVRKVVDKLACFVAKNGRQFEHITRQRNPGDTPFKFLFDTSCSDYKYYEYRLLQEEKTLAESKEPQGSTMITSGTSTARTSNSSQRNVLQQQSNYQTPASALYGAYEETGSSGESSRPSASDPIAMMEFYMKKAAQEERKRPPKPSKDEMPPPHQGPPAKKGHHMGDYIPQEELEKFLASCNDVTAQKAAEEAAERARIQADNIGHKLLSKMGWKEGEGLGSDRSGRADPVMAGNVKKDHLGVGAHNPGEVAPDDDIYEQYKKRMMLGYRHRPNPLNNPRKSYY